MGGASLAPLLVPFASDAAVTRSIRWLLPVLARKNGLFRELSREDYRKLAPHLKHVPLSLHDVLVERNKANNHVYFPLAGLISVQTISADHVSLDMVGREGMVGVFIAAGVTYGPGRAHSGARQRLGNARRGETISDRRGSKRVVAAAHASLYLPTAEALRTNIAV
jgi:hypothetical protein